MIDELNAAHQAIQLAELKLKEAKEHFSEVYTKFLELEDAKPKPESEWKIPWPVEPWKKAFEDYYGEHPYGEHPYGRYPYDR